MSVVLALVAACKSKACAPPPVGTGGSASAAEDGDFAMDKDFIAARLKLGKSMAVDSYCEMGFVAINSYLRGDTPEQREALLRQSLNSPDDPLEKLHDTWGWDTAVSLIPQIDEAFKSMSHALSRDTMLYRGVEMTDISEFKPGAVFTDKGFMSTTAMANVASGFTKYGRGGRKVVFHITAPKGTKVIPGTRGEREWILNRGTSMRVTKVTDSKNDHVVVHAELVQ